MSRTQENEQAAPVAPDARIGQAAPKAALLNDPRIRGMIIQAVTLAAIVWVVWNVARNAAINLERQGIASGFGFLDRESGFGINFSPFINYSETSSYGIVFLVGLGNTLLIAVVGIILATSLGFVFGVARLSSNWIVSRFAYAYVEAMRNVPLLLWIFIWYFAVLRLLPGKREPFDLGPFGLLNIAGYYAPKPVFGEGAWLIPAGFALAVAIAAFMRFWAKKRQIQTGRQFPVFRISLALLIGLPLLGYLLAGLPLSFEMPEPSRFGPRGGARIFPEFMGLLVALVTYTSAYIAEIVRAGILAVDKGQTEASYALGLRPGPALRLVVIPQAMRVIVPPMTNQYLNLTKNSSLAVAIAYPDLVSVFAGTSLNQTGQAVEILLMTMLTYLFLSLSTSMMTNWFNSRMALVER